MINPLGGGRPCPTCRGTKAVTVPVTDKAGKPTGKTESRPCPTCRGSGVSDGVRTK